FRLNPGLGFIRAPIAGVRREGNGLLWPRAVPGPSAKYISLTYFGFSLGGIRLPYSPCVVADDKP
ncbi:MAG: hypothetical protein WA888_18290, partial [Burkholderiaceae bacterium]